MNVTFPEEKKSRLTLSKKFPTLAYKEKFLKTLI
jgi:hypothetical protein